MKNTLIASFAGLALVAVTSVWAQGTRVSSQFHGKINAGTVTYSTEGNKRILTLSDDFKLPKAPDLHWQVVDSKGDAYLLQKLLVKGEGTQKADKLNKSITVPAYVPDISKVQIWCAYVEMSLGEASFAQPLQPTGR